MEHLAFSSIIFPWHLPVKWDFPASHFWLPEGMSHITISFPVLMFNLQKSHIVHIKATSNLHKSPWKPPLTRVFPILYESFGIFAKYSLWILGFSMIFHNFPWFSMIFHKLPVAKPLLGAQVSSGLYLWPGLDTETNGSKAWIWTRHFQWPKRVMYSRDKENEDMKNKL